MMLRNILRMTAACVCLMLLTGCWDDSDPGQPAASPAASALSYDSARVVPVSVAIDPLVPAIGGSVSGFTIAPALPAGLSIDARTGVVSGTPTQASASTTYEVRATGAAGPVSATFSLDVAGGPADTEQMVVPASSTPPMIDVSDYTPVSNQPVDIAIDAAGASNIALVARGAGCGAIASASAGGPALRQSGVVGATGQCLLSAEVTVDGATTSYGAEITVTPTELPAVASGLHFPGGGYFPGGDVGEFTQGQSVLVQSIAAPQTLINGGTGSIYVNVANPADVAHAVIAFDQVPGYFLAPVTVVNGQVRIDFDISADFAQRQQAQATRVRALSAAGRRPAYSAPVLKWGPRAPVATAPGAMAKASAQARRADLAAPTSSATLHGTVQLTSSTDDTISAPAPVSMDVQAVGTGPIQVSLTWSAPVDIDLHVLTPGADEISWSGRGDATGGALDLDSNAGCSLDNVNNENVVWTKSAAPAAGPYVVRVDLWSACHSASPIPYTVRVTNCGQSKTYTGTFDPANEDEGSVGSGVTIATFDYAPCAGLSVAGSVSYEDISPTLRGLKPIAAVVPVRSGQVEVHQQSDDALLATGKTDESGRYAIDFAMATPGPYYVKVLAQQLASDGKTVMQKVLNKQAVVYAIQSAQVDAATTPAATGVDIKATQAASAAPAFNILQIGNLGFVKATAIYGVSLPLLTWEWSPGVKTCAGAHASYGSCYQDKRIWINGVADASHGDDANNNSVLAHEFGHFVNEAAVLRRPAPGGFHEFDTRSAPSLAWSEGLATYWGQKMLNNSTYIQALKARTFTVSLETPNPTGSKYPVGTSDGSASGSLSEIWVAAILWDLGDSQKDFARNNGVAYADTIKQPTATFSVLSNLKTTTHNRGGVNMALVDFLDQWLCQKYSIWGTPQTTDLYETVVGLNQIPYAPDMPMRSPPISNCD